MSASEMERMIEKTVKALAQGQTVTVYPEFAPKKFEAFHSAVARVSTVQAVNFVSAAERLDGEASYGEDVWHGRRWVAYVSVFRPCLVLSLVVRSRSREFGDYWDVVTDARFPYMPPKEGQR